ncbi:MAG: hypothetical protein BroJett026_21880 [Betaproteobacteria bacterium]|nr:MAG: hypothetical protein BroJett026_21880 [Betaproteobacteria bacterium]
MKFMIIVKADADTEAGVMPPQSLIAEMAAYHEALQEAGVLVDANGLRPSAQGFRVRYEGDRRTVVDGPFAETKELVAGYTIIDVASRAQAVAWASRFPNPHPGKTNEIEVRPFYALEDFEPGEGVDRFRALDAERAR